MAIYPAQIVSIQKNLAPDQSEMVWAAQVVELMEASETGVVHLDGKMLDQPHLRLARKILANS